MLPLSTTTALEMAPPRLSKQVTGPPQAIISRIEYLGRLLKSLPSSLPLDPPDNLSTYFFGLDAEEVKAEGAVYALTQNLQRCFRTHSLAKGEVLCFKERGKRCESLVQLLKTSMRLITSPKDRQFIVESWVERLVTAAKNSGAKIPAKR